MAIYWSEMKEQSVGTRKFTIPLVVVSTRKEDRDNLESILADSAWQLFTVDTLGEAYSALRNAKTPIVICDAAIDGSRWSATIRSFSRARPGAYVIFLADDDRESVYQEIVRHGGFDVLTRPFQKEDVFRVLLFAYSHCRGTWLAAPIRRCRVYTQHDLGVNADP
jgi:DNA-binding NtrC family response regulator